MTVRLATEDDLFDVMVLAKEFCKEAPEAYVWDREKMETVIRQAIEEPNFVLLVSEPSPGEVSGVLLGVCSEMYMSRVKVATELAWFVSKESRGARTSLGLLKMFEEWASEVGADYVVMGDIKGVADLSSFYTKMGYSPSETTYIKRAN